MNKEEIAVLVKKTTDEIADEIMKSDIVSSGGKYGKYGKFDASFFDDATTKRKLFKEFIGYFSYHSEKLERASEYGKHDDIVEMIRDFVWFAILFRAAEMSAESRGSSEKEDGGGSKEDEDEDEDEDEGYDQI